MVVAWSHRCRCGACGAVLWVSPPTDPKAPHAIETWCVCSSTWIDGNGKPQGMAERVDDAEMVAFIRADWGREVSLEKSK
jgi:hypothetical protein